MKIFDLKLMSSRQKSVNTDGCYAEARVVAPVLALVSGAVDIIPWSDLKVTLIELLEANFIGEQNKINDNENLEIFARNLIETIEKSNTAQEFKDSYKIQISAKDGFEADRVVENFALMFVSVLNKSVVSRDEVSKFFDTVLKKDNPMFNCDGNHYNNFNYLITKIITDQELVRNREFFFDENGDEGFFYKLASRANIKTGTYASCVGIYLDTIYKLQFEESDEENRKFIISGAQKHIYNLIKNNKKNYDDYELLKMEEIYTAILKINREKHVPDDSDLVADIKKTYGVLNKKERIFLIKNIRDLQYGILTPIKYEKMPALYENEELLIAYFRMVNYLLMNYPDIIKEKEEKYREFIHVIKNILYDMKNKINKELFYSFLYRLYEKNYLKLLDHDWVFHIESEEPFDSLNVIFNLYRKEIDKDKKNYYDSLIFSK